MSKKKVTVDIIIPVFNCKSYFRRCIESILKQKSFSKLIRLIIVDDGSTDGSKEIIDNYKFKYDNILAVHISNNGVSQARNIGLGLVKADYFTFLDPDDWVSTNYFDFVIDQLQKNTVDILMTPYIRKYRKKSLKSLPFGEKTIFFNKENTKGKILRRLYGPVKSELRKPLTIDNISPVWSKFYKASKFKNVRFIDRNKIYSEDLWFNILCFLKAETVEYFPNVFYLYNKENNNSAVHKLDKNMLKEYMNLYMYMKDQILNENLDPLFSEALNNRIVLNELAILRNANSASLRYGERKNYIVNILNYPEYASAYIKFSFDYLPIKYRIFYMGCKYKYEYLVILLLALGEKFKTKIKQ